MSYSTIGILSRNISLNFITEKTMNQGALDWECTGTAEPCKPMSVQRDWEAEETENGNR